MGYKLVALDIDGTIRAGDRPVSDRTRRIVAEVIRAGVAVTLATGRSYLSAIESSGELDLRTPIVSFQGAHVADPKTGDVLWHQPLTPQMAQEALEALESLDGQVMAYHGDEIYVSRTSPLVDAYRERGRVRIHVVDDLTRLADDGLTRLVVVDEPDEVRLIETRLKAQFDSRLHITRSLPQFCEILHPEGGKHRALEWLCGHLGIDRSETMAFGNGPNDVHMLEWAGYGVAIGGAVPEAVEVADAQALTPEEDGVARMLEEMLDGGLLG